MTQTPSFPDPPSPAPASSDGPLRIRVSGAGEAAGEQYGAAARELIGRHASLVVARLAARGLEQARIEGHAADYRAAVVRRYPRLAAEVDGVARGAGLPVEIAWALQLRAELERQAGPECSSLALRDATGRIVLAQNLDLPPAYRELLVVLERVDADGPSFATVTPAGQIGQCGMNDAGVTAMANFVHAPGWRTGVPRYLLSRIVLGERTRTAAAAAVRACERAASRNLLIGDPEGAENLETTPTRTASLPLGDGPLWHTNHLVADGLADDERATPEWLRNSHRRYERLRLLLGGLDPERVDVASIAGILRDRQGSPDALCHLPGDGEVDYATVASVIALPAERRLWIATGPPTTTAYAEVMVP